MRRTRPSRSMPARRSRTAAPSTASSAAIASYGRGTSGRPAWVARIRRRSKGVSMAVLVQVLRQGQAQLDEEFPLLREGIHLEAAGRLDARAGRRGLARRGGSDDEPHVEGVLAAIVVGDLGQGVD